MAIGSKRDWDGNLGDRGAALGRYVMAYTGAMFIFIGLLVALPAFIWYGCRIEPQSDQLAVLIRKTGRDLPSGEILAQEPTQKGIQLAVLPEGRYFKNPYTWGWKLHAVIDIPAGKLGVQTRLYGRDLPPGSILADEGTKGIITEVLRPGKHRVNPYAFHVQLFDAVTIKPGRVGVVTSLVGKDVLSDGLPAEQRNTFLVAPDLKGVVERVKDPGTYYLNPYMYNIVEVNLQSQRFEMSGDDVITFLTEDGFTVSVEGTIEFALQRDSAALLTHRVGDMDDIMKKLILPRARGFSRIEGSKHPAINFIVGATRQRFQNDLDAHLRDKSGTWGVEIKSVLIRKIIVPDAIASISRDRELAVQEAIKFEQQIEQARSQAELAKQEMLALQNREKVESDTLRIRSLINAEQDKAVQMVKAERELEVARLRLEETAFRAEAILLRAEGDMDGIRQRNEAEAAVMESQVQALGGGMNLARYTFYQKIAPRIATILSGDGAGGMGEWLRAFAPEGKGVAQ